MTPWVLQVVGAVILRYRDRLIHPKLRGDILHGHFVRPQQSANGLQFLGVEFLRPTAVAATRPRSLEAGVRAPNTWNTSSPLGDRVSICSVSEAKPTPRALRSWASGPRSLRQPG